MFHPASLRRSLGLAALLLAGLVAGEARAQAGAEPLGAGIELAARDWLAKAADNICGLRDPAQLSSPARVDFDAVLEATPEMKELRDKKIDRNSPEGIRLTNAAIDRATKACESVRASLGHCSVWKEIKHRDGRPIADITDRVKAQF